MSGLRAGDWVVVRSSAEIRATLDRDGCLDGLPFMPEMLAYCGKRLRVVARAHKTCDTVNKTGGRRMTSAVHLDDVRCNGSSHGGCGADCLIFWKEAWLTPEGRPAATSDGASEPSSGQTPSGAVTEEDLRRCALTKDSAPSATDPTYACQATALPRATTYLPWWDFRQYVEDYTSGNATLKTLIGGAAFASFQILLNRTARVSDRASQRLIELYDRWQSLVGGREYPRKQGTVPTGAKTPSCPLNLEPGEWVKVKSYHQVLATLDQRNRNRGLFFDAEEVPYCDRTFRVRSRVSRIIDEKTGKMIHLKDSNVILDGTFCKGSYSDRRMFCPRAIVPIWRETWLEKVNTA